jgi:hypothetical protein
MNLFREIRADGGSVIAALCDIVLDFKNIRQLRACLDSTGHYLMGLF